MVVYNVKGFTIHKNVTLALIFSTEHTCRLTTVDEYQANSCHDINLCETDQLFEAFLIKA